MSFLPVRDYFQLQIKICMGIKLNAPAVQSVCEVFSCMVLSLRTGWDAHSGGVYIRNGHLVFKKKKKSAISDIGTMASTERSFLSLCL